MPKKIEITIYSDKNFKKGDLKKLAEKLAGEAEKTVGKKSKSVSIIYEVNES